MSASDGSTGGLRSGSRTARMVAAFRAWAMREHPGLFDDPYAAALAGPDGEADARRYVEAHPPMPLYMGLRTAWFDDVTRAAIAEGVQQIVVLGAGLDTRAIRLAQPGVTFFEVDRPASQADKRARLRAIGAPDRATFVACDFATDDFRAQLTGAGFAIAAPALFLWEGVVYYLPEAAVRATLGAIASLHERTALAMDLVGKRFVAGTLTGADDRAARDDVAAMGEPLRFGTDDPLPLLYEAGFRTVEVTSFDELALRYTGTYDRARKMRFQSVAWAQIAPRPR